MSSEFFCSKLATHCSSPHCVRDWSGILCERDFSARAGTVGTWLAASTGCGMREREKASKDIAESPTA